MAAVMMTVGMVGIASAPATDAPGDCTRGVAHDHRGWALCTSGSGEFRAKLNRMANGAG